MESGMQLSELSPQNKHATEKKEKFWYKQVMLDGFHGTSQKTLFKNICRNAKKIEPSDFYFLVALLKFIVQWILPPVFV